MVLGPHRHEWVMVLGNLLSLSLCLLLSGSCLLLLRGILATVVLRCGSVVSSWWWWWW